MIPKNRKSVGVIVFLLVLITLTSCASKQNTPPNYHVDPRFREVYNQLYWNETPLLGKPISNLILMQGSSMEKQYFENGVLIYNPELSPRFYLEKLSLDPPPACLDASIEHLPESEISPINGFNISKNFSAIYNKFGERWLGKPITNTCWSEKKGRLEQHFENFGFYQFLNDNPEEIHFIAYGEQKCANANCQGSLSNTTHKQNTPTPNVSNATTLQERIESRLDASFLGKLLAETYTASDGKEEIIYENIVIVDNPNNSGGISLRSIRESLNITADPLETQKTEMRFRVIENEKGYNVPLYFDNFIQRHSGYELSGEPFTRLQDKGNGIKQQCFEGYCLEYNPNTTPNVHLVPLGIEYHARVYNPTSTPTLTPTSTPKESANLELAIWEYQSQIPSTQAQQFAACVSGNPNSAQDFTVALTIFLPSGREKKYHFPKSDKNGCAFIAGEPIEAQNGTTIEYQVCVMVSEMPPLCKNDSFLIWENP